MHGHVDIVVGIVTRIEDARVLDTCVLVMFIELRCVNVSRCGVMVNTLTFLVVVVNTLTFFLTVQCVAAPIQTAICTCSYATVTTRRLGRNVTFLISTMTW